MGIHESQSRFYENLIGRSRAFCVPLLKIMKESFPEQMAGVTEDALYFDTANASLMNRRPERVMSRMAQRLRLQTPDYYDYEVRGEQHV